MRWQWDEGVSSDKKEKEKKKKKGIALDQLLSHTWALKNFRQHMYCYILDTYVSYIIMQGEAKTTLLFKSSLPTFPCACLLFRTNTSIMPCLGSRKKKNGSIRHSEKPKGAISTPGGNGDTAVMAQMKQDCTALKLKV